MSDFRGADQGKDEFSAIRKALKNLGAWRLLKAKSEAESDKAIKSGKHSRTERNSSPDTQTLPTLYSGEGSWRRARVSTNLILKHWIAPLSGLTELHRVDKNKLFRSLPSHNRRQDITAQDLIAKKMTIPWMRRMLALPLNKKGGKKGIGVPERLRWACKYPDDALISKVTRESKTDHWEE